MTTIKVGDTPIHRFPLVDEDGVVDVSSATITVSWLKPDGSTTVTASAGNVGFETDGTDGVVIHHPPTSFHDTPGTWRAEVTITTPSEQFRTVKKNSVKVIGSFR